MDNTKKYRLLKVIEILVFCMLLCQTVVFADAASVHVVLNGKAIEFDQQPIIENGRTLVPLRKIFESLNSFVEWDEETQTVSANRHGTEISLTIGSNIAKVNGNEYVLDVPAKTINGRTLVPARFVAESLNCKVDWNGDTNVVIIKSGTQLVDEENLHNVDEVTYGYFKNLIGNSIASESYNYSGFIKVTPGDKVYFTNSRIPSTVRLVTAYNADKKNLKEKGAENVTEYLVPENTEYIVVSSAKASTPYLKVSNDSNVDGFIAEEICVASGRTITIYGKQLLSEKTDGMTFEWNCSVGSADGDKYVVEGTDVDIGEYPLKVAVSDKNGKVIWSGSSTVKIVKNEVPEMKLLSIGDSITNNKPWFSKLDNLSSGKITFVGTRGKPYKHEGRSGFTSAGYMSDREYDFEKEGIHPFWDGERFNWNYYKETTGISPDAVQIFLGINSIQNNPAGNVANIVKMVDYIRNDDSDIPIFVVNTMYKGSLEKAEEHLKVFNLMEKLSTSLSGYDNVFIVPVAITHDSVNNYSAKDQIHPMDSGYEQIADCIYSSICANMK